jgi:hypothetical protein
MLRGDITISSATLSNKANLLSECGNVAAELLKEGCERIMIIWDLYPAWRDNKQPPCRKEDRAKIMESLAEAKVESPQIYLLEAWLLADGSAISQVLSKPTHKVTIKDNKHPERITKPKTRLNQIFKEKTGGVYNDRTDAEKIVKNINLKKLGCCPSFVRFAKKLTEGISGT